MFDFNSFDGIPNLFIGIEFVWVDVTADCAGEEDRVLRNYCYIFPEKRGQYQTKKCMI